MDFAKKHLEKLGWSEGQGLGKSSDGLVKHVQVDKKEDRKGLGAGDDAFFPWWDAVYNKAASNIGSLTEKKIKVESEEKCFASSTLKSFLSPSVSDEALFKLCKNRTVGIGARGITLSDSEEEEETKKMKKAIEKKERKEKKMNREKKTKDSKDRKDKKNNRKKDSKRIKKK